MKIIEIPETASTNSWMSEHLDSLDDPVLVYALSQTAGRGQRGNHWEAAPGMNLTASVLIRPKGMEAQRQFEISEAVALAVMGLLESYGIDAKIKWPNDIYCGDLKIAGILIENSILGRDLRESIIGIGLNVNQTEFLSDAPNPVSMSQITGERYDLPELAASFSRFLEERLYFSGEERHQSFLESLWRNDGSFYPFRDKAMDETFKAEIIDVETTGMLVVRTCNKEERKYAFKEVEFII